MSAALKWKPRRVKALLPLVLVLIEHSARRIDLAVAVERDHALRGDS